MVAASATTKKKYFYSLDQRNTSWLMPILAECWADTMGDRENYFCQFAIRLSNWCEKPSAIILAVAFLLLWTGAVVFADVPFVAHLIVNAAISIIILLMVILLQNAHKQDIRALQARIENLIAERQAIGHAPPDLLTAAELQQVRDLLHRSSNTDTRGRANRDRRPSLF
jgi:low affinity Fe/Cu permease